METSIIYSYILIADEEGEYTIDPATIVVDGKEIKSQSMKIKVVKDEGTSQADRGQSRPRGVRCPGGLRRIIYFYDWRLTEVVFTWVRAWWPR